MKIKRMNGTYSVVRINTLKGWSNAQSDRLNASRYLQMFTDGRDIWLLHKNDPRVDMDDVLEAVLEGR